MTTYIEVTFKDLCDGNNKFNYFPEYGFINDKAEKKHVNKDTLPKHFARE